MDRSVIHSLAAALSLQITGYVLEDAYSLSKTELVLNFRKGDDYFSLRLFIRRQTILIFAAHSPFRKPSNAQAIFEPVWGEICKAIWVQENERSFCIDLGSKGLLFFKMWGALANVLLLSTDRKVMELFRPDIKTDHQLDTKKLKDIAPEKNVRHQFRVYANTEKIPLRFTMDEEIEDGKQVFISTNLLEAYTEYSKLLAAFHEFTAAKTTLHQQAANDVQKVKKAIALTQKGIAAIETERSPEETGHLLMANTTAILPGMESIQVYDWFTDSNLQIKLDPKLSPWENAEKYYRKSRSRKIEVQKLNEKISALLSKLPEAQKQLEAIDEATHMKALLPFLKQKKKETEQRIPFYIFEWKGYTIWVGKNAANNDLLTTRYAHKNDLWLHAKGVSGSHVVIQHKGNNPFDPGVIERAAELAAWYSKSKGSAWVPVAYTLKKFVRKPKGAEPGQVFMEKEDVLMVQPKLN
ncbi:MAG: NFACT RNA binding domain-containing protein [Bacteroidia bacterium]|jgi:predicted ribosome quality control (RQC) complex YloA/Tae2 family protein